MHMENSRQKSMSRKALIGGLWAVAGKVGGKMIDLLTFVVLAHFLMPEDVGLVAIAMTWILIVEAILDLPLAAALLRYERPTEGMFNTAFTLGLLRAALIALVMVALALPISWFYEKSDLTLLILVLSLAPMMRGLINPRLIVFAKQFDFRRDFAIDIAGKLTAFVAAVAVAAVWQSHWAIAAATLAGPFVAMVLSYVFIPVRPRLTLSAWREFSEIVSWHSVSQVISAINWQLERLILPRFISTATFGQFALAGDISALPQQAIAQPLVKPVVAALATRETPEKLRQLYQRLIGFYMIVLGTIYLVTGALSDELLWFAFGEKWRGAAPFLTWIAFSSILTIPVAILSPLALRLNRMRFVTIRMAAEFAVKIPMVTIGIYLAGIEGALMAQTLSAVVILGVTIWSVRKMIGLRLIDQLMTMARPGLALAGAYGVFLVLVHPLGADSDGIKLLTFIFAAAVTLVITSALLHTLIWLASGKPDGAEASIRLTLGEVFSAAKSGA